MLALGRVAKEGGDTMLALGIGPGGVAKEGLGGVNLGRVKVARSKERRGDLTGVDLTDSLSKTDSKGSSDKSSEVIDEEDAVSSVTLSTSRSRSSRVVDGP